MVSGGMTCVKYLLFCFNLLFVISGIAILTVGAVIQIVYSHYRIFVDDSYHSLPLALIGVGIVIFIVAFFGCCGAVKENHCMIVTYSILLFVILALEISVGIYGYVKKDDIGGMLENKLNSTMYEYPKSENIKDAWDIAQHEAQCCGIQGPSDWMKVFKNDTLPHTCCPDTKDDGSCTMRSRHIYQASCFKEYKETFVRYSYIIGSVGLGIALSQLIGVIFACMLARSVRAEYETV